MISVLTHISFKFMDVEPSIESMISFTILFIFEIALDIFVFNYIKNLRKNLKELDLSNTTLNNMYYNLSAFKHDFNNIMQAIGGCIETKDLDSLKDYYSNLVCDCHSISTLEKLSSESLNNPIVQSILTSKYYKANLKNIVINFDIEISLDHLKVTNYELVRMIGILLDNSIEAAEECSKKEINVKFCNDLKCNRDLIIIENTYLNKDIDTTKIFEKSYTTKKNNTGLGLWEVSRILNRHNNLNLFTTKNKKFFIQQLEIYNN